MVTFPQNEVTEEELEDLLKIGKLAVNGYELSSEEVRVTFTFNQQKADVGETWETMANNSVSFLYFNIGFYIFVL